MDSLNHRTDFKEIKPGWLEVICGVGALATLIAGLLFGIHYLFVTFTVTLVLALLTLLFETLFFIPAPPSRKDSRQDKNPK